MTRSPVSNYAQLIHFSILFHDLLQFILLHGAWNLAHEHFYRVRIWYRRHGGAVLRRLKLITGKSLQSIHQQKASRSLPFSPRQKNDKCVYLVTIIYDISHFCSCDLDLIIFTHELNVGILETYVHTDKQTMDCNAQLDSTWIHTCSTASGWVEIIRPIVH